MRKPLDDRPRQFRRLLGLCVVACLAAPALKGAAAEAQPRPADRRQSAVIRVECPAPLPAPLCDAARSAATEAAGHVYRVIDASRVEAVLAAEPALRGCLREDCRVAITDQVGAAKLIDVTLHLQPRGHGIVGAVSIYDPLAKGISGDTELPQTRRDEQHVRRTVYNTVEYVLGAQRLTAAFHLIVEPEGARVKIDGQDRGTVRDLRLFLGTHTVRVEKVGFIPNEQTVNVTPAGAELRLKLQPLPVPVQLEWSPPEARILIDGDPVDARNPVVELVEGRHRVQALAPPGSGYASRDLDLDVRVGMPPYRIQLQRQALLRIRAPRGYGVRLDNQIVGTGEDQGKELDLTTPANPGPHTVTAVSWRGRQLTQNTVAVPGNRTEVRIRAPALWPGALLGSAGLLAIVGGAVALPYNNQCIDAPKDPLTECPNFYATDWQSYTAFGVGGAALLAGAIWFGYNAANHPWFHRSAERRAGLPSRMSLVPQTGRGEAKLMLVGTF